MSCTFYGDFIPKEYPTSYQQAVMFCRNISQQLGENNEKAVPVEVSMLPLIYLEKNAAVLKYNIENDLVEKTANVFEKLYDLDVKCNDLLETEAAGMLTYNARKVKRLQALGAKYKTFFKGKIAQILPKIRGGEAKVSELSEILKAYKNSPFSRVLDVAMKHEKQLNVLTRYLEYLRVFEMSDIRFVTPLEFDSVIFDPAMKRVACFKIKYPTRDPSEEHLESYLEN